MAENSLFPAYVQFQYHSIHGVHSQIVPTREWNNVPLVPGNALGSYTNWSEAPCDGELMVIDLATALAEFLLPTGAYDTATVYTLESETAPPRPRATLALAIAGTSAGTFSAKATSQTFIARDSEFGLGKLVQYDIPVGDFNPLSDLSGSAEAQDIFDTWSAPGWAWATRNGLRPENFVRIVYDLNDKLRREYGMG